LELLHLLRQIEIENFNMSKRKRNCKLENQRRKQKNLLWYLQFIKGKCCEHCGNNNPIVFEWHHVDPTQKERLVSEMLNRWSLPSIKKEIAKCILLCANCHREVHAGISQLPLDIPKFVDLKEKRKLLIVKLIQKNQI
jgi:hypothetical protein